MPRERLDKNNPAAAALKRRGSNKVMDRRASDKKLTVDQLIAKAEDLAHVTGPAEKQASIMITSPEELALVRSRKRKEFEEKVTRFWKTLSHWLDYASWEAGQDDQTRARDVYKRAVDAQVHNVRPQLWREFAEFEIKCGKIDNARQVWAQALRTLPQEDVLWVKALLLEQAAQQDANTRDMFNAWLSFGPGAHAWKLFAKYEVCRLDMEATRNILSDMVSKHNTLDSWLFYAEIEEVALRNVPRAVRVIEEALRAIPNARESASELYLKLSQLHVANNNMDAARQVLRDALENISGPSADPIVSQYTRLERQHGDAEALSALTMRSRMAVYKQRLEADPRDYGACLSAAILAKIGGNGAEELQLLQSGASQVPEPRDGIDLPHLWGPYLQIVGRFAHAALAAVGVEGARGILKQVLQTVPHDQVDASALWIQAAELERVAAEDLAACRAVLGEAIGRAPRRAIFDYYSRMENDLGETDRVRKVTEAYLTRFPDEAGADAWIRFSQNEQKQGEVERAEAILESALQREALPDRSKVWAALVVCLMRQRKVDAARGVYDRLLSETLDRVQESKATAEDVEGVAGQASQFMMKFCAAGAESPAQVPRQWMMSTAESRRNAGQTAAAEAMYDAWRAFERQHGNEQTLRAVDEAQEAKQRKRNRLFKRN